MLEDDRGGGVSVAGVFFSVEAAEAFLRDPEVSSRYCYLSSAEGEPIKEQIDASDIITALRRCDMNKVAEGVIYWTLFNRGLSPDEATQIVQELLGQDGVTRTGVVVSLTPQLEDHLADVSKVIQPRG